MIPNENVKVTALQVAAFHDGNLYSGYPTFGSLRQRVHIPGYLSKESPPLNNDVKSFEGMISEMGYSAPPSFSVDDIFGDKPSGTEIRAQNKTIGYILGTELLDPKFLYNEDPKLVRETVESFYSNLKIDEFDLEDTGMQIIRLDVKMNELPAFSNSNSTYRDSKYRTLHELNHSNVSPAVKHLMTKKKFLFE